MTTLSAKTRLLQAALAVVREKGFGATTVDDLCQKAGVSKGAFFHHFRSKEDLAIASTTYWTEWTGAMFASASYHSYEDPLDQLVAYVDFRAAMLDGCSLAESTCLLGTLVQETYDSHPAIRDAGYAGIHAHAQSIATIIAAAKSRHAPLASWSVEGLALHTQAVIQGAFILAKAGNDLALARDSILHLRRYIELLFHHAKED
jgi:TetR/AcrR family transcriptional regulator, transcriptional repressor for nem operon